MYYGPAQTRILHADGRSLVREDSLARVTLRDLCREELGPRVVPVDSLADRDRAWLWNIDLWRERALRESPPIENDPELDRRLRALGYLQ